MTAFVLSNRQVEYRAYLTTPVWKAKRAEALAFYGCICNRCKEYGNDVHHKTYERVGGGELMEDLEILCRGCHEAHHLAERFTGKKRRKGKRGIHRRAIFPALSKKMKLQLRKDFDIPSDPDLFASLAYGNNEPLRLRAMKMIGCDYHFGSNPAVKRRIKYKKEPYIKPQEPYHHGVAFVE